MNFSVAEGEFVAIMGESGSGKTTLLNILAALDKPTSGEVLLDGQEHCQHPGKRDLPPSAGIIWGLCSRILICWTPFPCRTTSSCPWCCRARPIRRCRQRLVAHCQAAWASTDLLKKYPYEVSGGQKQRAAVARALITDPRLILADEPTGALDSKATDEPAAALFDRSIQDGQTILMVTHSAQAASHAGRVLFIKDGEVFHQIYRGNSTSEQRCTRKSPTRLTMLATGGEQA